MFDDLVQTLGPAHALQYRVLCDSQPVGHIRAQRRRVLHGGDAALWLRNEVSIRADGWWSGYRLDAEEEMLLDAQGLCRYVGLSMEDGDKTSVTAEREGGQLSLQVRGDRVHIQQIGLADIDAVSEDAATWFLRSQQSSATLRVLDLDQFDIDEVQFRLMPPQSLALAGTEYATQVVSFESRKRRISGMGWYVPDDSGYILMREVSRAQGELNDVLLIEWNHTS